MSLVAYVRGHLARLACSLAVLALLAVMLPVLGVEREATELVVLLACVIELAGYLWDWVRERPFTAGLERALRAGDAAPAAGTPAHAATPAGAAPAADTCAGDLLDAIAELPEPTYPEGELAWGALQEVVRESRRRVAGLEEEMREYRRYVELWVHEVKTPLAAMNLMLANPGGPDARALSRELARVEADVEGALFYARSTSVSNDYLIRRCDLADLVREAVRSRARSLIEARVSVDLSGLEGAPAPGPESAPAAAAPAPGAGAAAPAPGLEPAPAHARPWVYCDPKWMAFVLGQLVDNAVRYRAVPERDGREPRLSFSASVEDAGGARERVVLHVADNGCGIREADLGRVFERGFTGENGRTHERSTGMGLYLVRTLCEKMGLSVGARSAAGVGTTIDVTFPRERSREA
jgi:signal transduction histidine kinase